VESVEKLYIWSITPSQIKLCADLRVAALSVSDRDQLVKSLQMHLHQEFGVHEAMLQLLETDAINKLAEIHPLLHRSLTSYVFGNTQDR
jgi:Co/Zn/Cd efflux system component